MNLSVALLLCKGRKPFAHRNRGRSGFTLTELLVTISIVSILLAISFPAAQAVRQAARRAHCLTNLRQVMLATLSYESKGVGFPPADNGDGQSFIMALLPYLEENRLVDRSRDSLEIGETRFDRLSELSQTPIVPLVCPAASLDDHPATVAGHWGFTSHYYGVAGPTGAAEDYDTSQTFSYTSYNTVSYGPVSVQGIFSPRQNGKFVPRRLKDVTDGTSNTLGIGEISSIVVAEDKTPQRPGWAFGAGYDSSNRANRLYSTKSISRPINSVAETLNDTPFSSNHPGGTHFAMLDGSVHYIDESIGVDILKIYASINKREKHRGLDAYQ